MIPRGEIAVLLTSHKKLEQLERIVNAIESVVEGLPRKEKRDDQTKVLDSTSDINMGRSRTTHRKGSYDSDSLEKRDYKGDC